MASRSGQERQREATRGPARGPASRGAPEHLQETLTALRKHCPPPLPVVVKLCRLPDDLDGQTIRNPREFIIRLARQLDENRLVNVLLHEWAHCLSWSLKHDRIYDDYEAGKTSWTEYEAGCHDGAFGVAFAQAHVVYTTKVLPTPDEPAS